MNTKGHVSNVKLSPTLAANASGVTIVWLLNLNLQSQVDDIPQMVPPKIQYLALDNGLFSNFPKGMSSLTALKGLYVQCVVLFLGGCKLTISHSIAATFVQTTSRAWTRPQEWTDSQNCTFYFRVACWWMRPDMS